MPSALCAAVYSVFTVDLDAPRATVRDGACDDFRVAALLPVVIFKNGGIAIPTFSFEGWLAVLFLGTVAGVIQFSLFMWALRWLPPTTTVLYLTLNPITAMVLGIALLGEKLTPELVAGMVLVLVGIVIGSGIYSARRITASAST
jgi:drug/metabolite transporter (DMT)-like permease